jgi:hypothetical protein
MQYRVEKEKVVSEIFEDEAVIVNLTTGAYYSFRGAAIWIWKMAAAGYTQDEILQHLDSKQEGAAFLAYLINERLLLLSADVLPREALSVPMLAGLPAYDKYDDMKDLLLLDPIHEVDQKGWPHKKDE